MSLALRSIFSDVAHRIQYIPGVEAPQADDWKPTPPAGYVAIQGDFDHLCKRFDLDTSSVMDYQPPQPDTDHEWNAQTKRWRKRADVVARETQRADAQRAIEALERQQLRSLRELAIDSANTEASQRLAAIDAQIATLRELLQVKED